MMKVKVFLFVVMISALLLSACAAPAVGTPASAKCTPTGAGMTSAPQLVIGTGGKGGVFYPYGEGLAKIMTANMPGVTTTFLETGGSVDNMKFIQSGKVQVGLSTVDSAFDAVQGQGAYAENGKIPACALAVLYTSFVHIVASEASGINNVAGMKGRVVSVGDSGSSTEGAAERILEAAGLNPQTDITRRNLSIADATTALNEGTIDAFFWIGGLPTKAVSDMLSTGVKVKFIDASQYVQPLAAKYGAVYRAFTLPKDVYGTQADIAGIGIGNILFVNANMSEDQAYQILKTIFAHLDEVHALHPQARNLILAEAVVGSSIPFHPGAIRFYKEQGVWKE
jgi:TRAP transporter TAXI family solute receptor